jgi:hypothetical protein
MELFRENILVELAQELKLQRLVDLSLAKVATPGNVAAGACSFLLLPDVLTRHQTWRMPSTIPC